MHRSKRWNIPNPQPDRVAALADRLRCSSVLAQILVNRGMDDPAVCRAFLTPSLSALHPPAAFAGLERAARRIVDAIAAHELIVIFGDYDVDGITATSILWHAITQLGGNVRTYIPHRVDEGYGLKSQAVTQLCDQGAKLIVTVDCGITAIEPALTARQRGVDLIITDHHEWTQENGTPKLPDCFAILHPRLSADGHADGDSQLCGTGVAFKLAWGIGLAASGGSRVDEGFRDFLVNATALAALGTIADVVPLVGENRVLAHVGLKGLTQSTLRGIRALIASSNLAGKKLDSYHVGFQLGPRLNACGRMGHARLAVEMFTVADEQKAHEIATHLEHQNRQRQAMEHHILEQAIEQITQTHQDDEQCPAIVLASDQWHPGVIGIVASRLVDRFYRPTIMIALKDGYGQGSGRSIPGFHLAHALDVCDKFLETHGGHEMAAGLRIAADQLDPFRSALCAHASQTLAPEQFMAELELECAIELKHATEPLVMELKRLEPFGQSNRRPMLLVQGAQVAAPPRRVGKDGKTLQLLLRQQETTMKGVGFNLGELADRLTQGTQVDLVVELALSEYLGRTSVELIIRDVRWE